MYISILTPWGQRTIAILLCEGKTEQRQVWRLVSRVGISRQAGLAHQVLCTSVYVARTIKNPETDIGVQAEDQKSKAAKSLESSYLCQSSKEWSCPRCDCRLQCSPPSLRLQLTLIIIYLCLLLLSVSSHTTPVITSLVLGFKMCDSWVLGTPLYELYFSF